MLVINDNILLSLVFAEFLQYLDEFLTIYDKHLIVMKTHLLINQQLDEKSKELDDLKSQWMVKLNELSSRHYDEMNLTKQQEMKVSNKTAN